MTQFFAGATKTAKVTMRNPTSKPFDYHGTLYMGVNKVTMVEADFHLNAGESKEVSFSVVMPSAAGQYPVYISVFSGGNLIGHYQSTEDVTVLAVPAFAFENFSAMACGCLAATAFQTPHITCVIRNPTSQVLTHTITLMWRRYSYTYQKWVDTGSPVIQGPKAVQMSLKLNPGQQYSFLFEGNYYNEYGEQQCDPLMALHYDYYFWLQDEAGNKSPESRIWIP